MMEGKNHQTIQEILITMVSFLVGDGWQEWSDKSGGK
jgi:hypothetical protein